MAKKKKKIYKGVGYIESILLKYAKTRFTTKNSARLRAREIASDLQQSGQSVSVKSVMSLIRNKRIPKQLLTLPQELTNVSHYFELSDYPRRIIGVINKFSFVSKISSADLPSIQGGSDIDYETYFAPFVNYCNAMKNLTPEAENRYETDWFVRCTIPDKQGVSKIISCSADGVEFDYGFDTSKPSKKPKDAVTSGLKKEEKKPEEKKEEKPTTETKKEVSIDRLKIESEERIRKAQIESEERVRQAKMQDLKELLKDKTITFEQYQKALKDI